MAVMALINIRHVWHWWKTEIAGLLPVDNARLSASRAATVELYIGPDHAGLFRRPRLARSLPAAADLASAIEATGKLRSGDRVVISVEESHCLVRYRSIPLSGLSEAPRILALEVARTTPFSTADVIMGWYGVGRPNKDGQQPVAHVILKRSLVDPLLEAIKARRARPIAIAVRKGSASALPFVVSADGLPFGLRQHRRWLGLLAYSAVVAVVACGMAGFAALDRQRGTLQRLEAEIERHQILAKDVRADLEARNNTLKQHQELLQLRQAQLPGLAMWEELTRLLPDEAWLQSLSLETGDMQIEGSAKSVEPLIPLLEGSPFFRDARFTSPIFKSPDNQSVRFSIRMTLDRPSR